MVPHDPQAVIDRVRELARPLAAELGLELFDVEYQPRGGLLRVFIDRPAGEVGIGDCQAASERLSAALDEADPIPHAYRLEVSSPGLDRPLRGPDDYRRFRGRLAHLVLSSPVDGRGDLTGRIDGTEGGMVRLLLDGGGGLWLPLAQVKKARLVVEVAKGTKRKQ
ncbi:MAG: ribosome maturation factor RimP [Candidatus Edwardsbacteria bacterium]|jgi:ribosome maturation factor RimP|nr:ribosome maturation factor RimP [Candidatus Edwardsbacteria bacterium]